MLLLLVGILVLVPIVGQAQDRGYTGVWVGTTVQNHGITLVIEGRTLKSVTVRVDVQGGPPDYCTWSVRFVASASEGMFYITDTTIDLYWEQDNMVMTLTAFFYGNRAEGAVRLDTLEGGNPPCVGSGVAAWQATNRDVPPGDDPIVVPPPTPSNTPLPPTAEGKPTAPPPATATPLATPVDKPGAPPQSPQPTTLPPPTIRPQPTDIPPRLSRVPRGF
jgi:hypothetical protein